MLIQDRAELSAGACSMYARDGWSRAEFRRGWRLGLCAGLLALLITWAYFWPQTGDGDAITHFIIARDGLGNPALLMGAWARVGAKLLLLIPAQFGLFATRCVSACISIVCAWQTMRLADDLEIPSAILAAPMMIFQPLVFGLAGDTMTEIPMALGLVIAIRLWLAHRWMGSALVVSFLPLVRPEGFFLCALWGAMILWTTGMGTPARRVLVAATLASGVAIWIAACWIICQHPTYLIESWPWQVDSKPLYARGSFFSYVNRWPYYCGPLLFPLFLLGLRPLLRHRAIIAASIALLIVELAGPEWLRESFLPWPALWIIAALAWARRQEKIALAWWALLLVLTVHSVLWWGGWFGSDGLLRIMGCASPITAVISLQGWNILQARLRWLGDYRWLNIASRGALAGGLVLVAMVYYVDDPMHYRVFGVHQVGDFIRAHIKLKGVPALIFRDQIAQADLGLSPNPSNIMPLYANRIQECRRLLSAPIGSIGEWDDQHRGEPFNVDIQDLPTLGYSILFKCSEHVTRPFEYWLGMPLALQDQEYVVIRKERPGEMPSTIPAILATRPSLFQIH